MLTISQNCLRKSPNVQDADAYHLSPVTLVNELVLLRSVLDNSRLHLIILMLNATRSKTTISSPVIGSCPRPQQIRRGGLSFSFGSESRAKLSNIKHVTKS